MKGVDHRGLAWYPDRDPDHFPEVWLNPSGFAEKVAQRIGHYQLVAERIDDRIDLEICAAPPTEREALLDRFLRELEECDPKRYEEFCLTDQDIIEALEASRMITRRESLTDRELQERLEALYGLLIPDGLPRVIQRIGSYQLVAERIGDKIELEVVCPREERWAITRNEIIPDRDFERLLGILQTL